MSFLSWWPSSVSYNNQNDQKIVAMVSEAAEGCSVVDRSSLSHHFPITDEFDVLQRSAVPQCRDRHGNFSFKIRSRQVYTEKHRPNETKLSVGFGVPFFGSLFHCRSRMNPPRVCAIRFKRLKLCREASGCWSLKCMKVWFWRLRKVFMRFSFLFKFLAFDFCGFSSSSFLPYLRFGSFHIIQKTVRGNERNQLY